MEFTNEMVNAVEEKKETILNKAMEVAKTKEGMILVACGAAAGVAGTYIAKPVKNLASNTAMKVRNLFKKKGEPIEVKAKDVTDEKETVTEEAK